MAHRALNIPLRSSLNGRTDSVSTALAALPGIEDLRVTDGAVALRYDSAVTDAERLVMAIAQAGGSPAVKNARFVVTGMHCSSCAIAIERVLVRLPGVISAELTFATEKVGVIYDPRSGSPARIRAAIESVGFGTLTEGDAAARESAQIRDLRVQKRSLLMVLLLGGPILVHMVLSWFHLVPQNRLLLFAFATPLQIIIGWHYYRASWQALRHAHVATSDVLVAIGSTAAYAYSVATTFWIVGPVYYDTQAMVLVFVMIGKYLKVAATSKSTEAVRALVGLQARTANLVNVETGKLREVPIDDIKVGDIIVIRQGERAPLDGVVSEGDASFDEAMLTGESMPLEKRPGDSIIAGSIDVLGVVRVRVERVGENTTLAQIIRLVESAQGGKIAVMDLADRISYVFVPAVIALATTTLLGWLLHGASGASALAHAVAALVIACPCALSLAPGTAIAVATGEAARRGVLIKGGRVLEHAHRLDVVLLDKTGTLTHGRPTLTSTATAHGIDKAYAHALAAALEAHSMHPLASAIVAEAPEERPRAHNVETVSGSGVRADVEAGQVLVGRLSWLQSHGVDTSELDAQATGFEVEAMSVVALALNGRILAVFGISDEIKPHAAQAVRALRTRGLRVAMVTGDNAGTAHRVAGLVGIEEVYADVRPDGKAEIVRGLQRAGLRVAVVGDGINDAPALGQADVGIAMGTGSDVASSASDITLIGDDLRYIASSIALSDSAFRIIAQNFVFAFGFNGLGLPIAALGFLDPVLAASSMALSSAAVVGNSLRLRGQARRLLEIP
ncbi:MAG: copper-exporting P-type ATPase CopA [Candidatus Velthaea sp.]